MPTDPNATPETFSWKKFFAGIVDPLTTAKISAHALHVALLILLLFLLFKGFSMARAFLFPHAKESHEISYTSGGHVETSPDKKVQIGFFNK